MFLRINQRPRSLATLQAHRGGRGNTVENTLPAFAWGLIYGASTLELDNGITKVNALLLAPPALSRTVI